MYLSFISVLFSPSEFKLILVIGLWLMIIKKKYHHQEFYKPDFLQEAQNRSGFIIS